ncbi:MAG: CheB methylesterase domain-containing protein [Pirellula sp.]
MYIAPGGKKMKVERNLTNIQIRVTDDTPVGACKPSVDYLFESIGSCYGRDTLAIIMTGMGSDGLAGCKKLHGLGARILAQDEASCVVYGMPRQIAENGLAHEILALDMVAARITQLIKK